VKPTDQPPNELTLGEAYDRIRSALEALRFGSVEVQVHDSRIVRITRIEKVRVETSLPPGKEPPG
jgi:hypothetical protein